MNKFCLIIAVLLSLPLFAAADDTIIPFSEQFAVNVLAKYGLLNFIPEQSGQYTSDNPWALGVGLRYKGIAARIYLPSFYAFNSNPFESFDIQLASYYESIYYEAFCKRYQGFTTEETTDSKSVDLSVFSFGIQAGWILNNKKHSLSAVYDLDNRQQSSSGSVILGFGVFYTSILSDDKNIKHYNNNQRFIYFGPNVGYSYTFIFPKNIFLNMNLVIGLDAGLNTSENRWLFIPLVIPKIAFGHHNNTWSINMIAGCNYTAILWDINTFDNLLSATMTLTFSKRF